MASGMVPVELVDDTVEAHLHRHSRIGGPVYAAVLVLLLAALAALPWVRVGVSIQAPGTIRPVLEKHEVRTGVGGFTDGMAVVENQEVERGQLLIALRGRRLEVREAAMRERLLEAEGAARDLGVLLIAADPHDVPAEALGTPRYRAERALLRGQLAELEARLSGARRRARTARALFERGLVPAIEVADAEEDLVRIGRERDVLLAARRTTWRAERSAAERELRELAVLAAELEEERDLHLVVAPVAGSVERVARVSPGSFVQPGELLAVISPDVPLVAEVLVSPRDVGLLRPGTPVRLHIDAFNHSEWGHLPGRVLEIPGDHSLIGQRPAFRVVVSLDRTELSLASGARGEIRKGMTLNARFMLAERSLLQLLRDDVADWLDPVRSPPAGGPAPGPVAR